MSSGQQARNGFDPLAELDSNTDGTFDSQDTGWSHLLVWRDQDSNGISSTDELTTAAQEGLLAISLRVSLQPSCDDLGRCMRERAEFQWARAGYAQTGTVIDVYLPTRSAASDALSCKP